VDTVLAATVGVMDQPRGRATLAPSAIQGLQREFGGDVREIPSENCKNRCIRTSFADQSNAIEAIPAETERMARAAFPRGTTITRLRDECTALYRDEDFAPLYPRRGQPGLAPWRLALVTVFQFLEHRHALN